MNDRLIGLGRRLRDAVDGGDPAAAWLRGATASDDVLVAALAGRVRQRRRVRAGAAGVLVAAAAVVAARGVAMADGPDATPPPPAVSPTPQLSLNCGADVPVLPTQTTAEGEGVLITGVAGAPSPADEPIPTTLRWENRGSTDLVVDAADVRVAAVRDGLVVAVGSVDNLVTGGTLAAGARAQSTDPVEFVPCGADAPLTAGEYALVAVATVHDDGRVQQFVSPAWQVTLGAPSGGADSATVAAQAVIADLVEASGPTSAQGPFGACGTQLMATDNRVLAATLVLDVPSAGATPTYRPGGDADGELSLTTRRGLQVVGQAPTRGAAVVLTRAGVVVAQAPWDAGAEVPLVLGPDDVRTLPAHGVATLCSAPGGDAQDVDLPPGTYQAYAVLDVLLDQVTDDDGPVAAVGATHVRSQPVTVQVRSARTTSTQD